MPAGPRSLITIRPPPGGSAFARWAIPRAVWQRPMPVPLVTGGTEVKPSEPVHLQWPGAMGRQCRSRRPTG
jgi:hypothetical protein